PWLYPNTDWFGAVIKPMSLQTRGNVALRGSGERIGYYLSLGGLTEDGYYRNSATRYNQYNFRSNIDGRVTDHLGLRFDVSGRLEDRNFPNRSAGSIFRALMRGKPNLPAYWPNGLPGPDIEFGDKPDGQATDEHTDAPQCRVPPHRSAAHRRHPGPDRAPDGGQLVYQCVPEGLRLGSGRSDLCGQRRRQEQRRHRVCGGAAKLLHPLELRLRGQVPPRARRALRRLVHLPDRQALWLLPRGLGGMAHLGRAVLPQSRPGVRRSKAARLVG